MRKILSLVKIGAAALLVTSLSSCEDVLEQYLPKPTPPPTSFPGLGLDIPFYTLSGGIKLDAYSTANPAARTASVAITGLQGGEKLLAIDFRPATGQLYGVGSTSRLYVINQKTGAARAIGAGPFSPAVQGNLVGFDFNPTVDRIRLVTNTGQNLRLNPETGTVAATDGSLNGAPGANVTGAAYTNNTAGASTTALYAINTQNQQLYLVNPPNDGTLVPVGSLNLAVSGDGGFDIDAKTGTALGLYSVQGKLTLFSVNLSTGAARPLAEYAANLGYSGLAIPTQPVAYAIATIYLPRSTSGNVLYSFDPSNSSDRNARVRKNISGLGRNQVVKGLDFRPATGELYALVSGEGGEFRNGITYTPSTRLYAIDLTTGAAKQVADLSIPLPFYDSYALDFNPVADRIRIASTSGLNLRVNPADGAVIEDGRINPSSVTVTSVAYTNSIAGATSTSLYTLGYTGASRKLYLQNPPNAGTLAEVAPVNLNVAGTDIYTFDIGGTTNTAYGLTPLGSVSDYIVTTVDLATGKATETRRLNIEGGPSIQGIAVGLGF